MRMTPGCRRLGLLERAAKLEAVARAPNAIGDCSLRLIIIFNCEAKGYCYIITRRDYRYRVVPATASSSPRRSSRPNRATTRCFIRNQRRAGHGGGKPTAMRIEELTDEWSFLVKSLKMKVAE